MTIKTSLLFLIIVLASSCVSQKEITYFQPADEKSDKETLEIREKYTAKIQTGDILNILVSSLSPEANEMFNIFPQGLNQGQNQTIQSNTTIPAIGFLVDNEGNITLPLTGKVSLSGLSTKEASDLLTTKLEQYLVQPTVNVRIVNYKISVLGEVARPSVYTISNERITLPEALSLAGDLTIFGMRKNILVIREVDGKREFARVDLTKRELFNSPYYYLRPNDIIYVEPAKGRITNTSRAVQLSPIFISALTLLTVIAVNLFK